jgi:hypothetical protein
LYRQPALPTTQTTAQPHLLNSAANTWATHIGSVSPTANANMNRLGLLPDRSLLLAKKTAAAARKQHCVFVTAWPHLLNSAAKT